MQRRFFLKLLLLIVSIFSFSHAQEPEYSAYYDESYNLHSPSFNEIRMIEEDNFIEINFVEITVIEEIFIQEKVREVDWGFLPLPSPKKNSSHLDFSFKVGDKRDNFLNSGDYQPRLSINECLLYAHMTAVNFKEAFKKIQNESRILEQYELYAFPGFRSFASSLPSYEKSMCRLDEKIKKDKKVRRRTEYVEGFEYSYALWKKTSSGFHKFVHQEAEKIREKIRGNTLILVHKYKRRLPTISMLLFLKIRMGQQKIVNCIEPCMRHAARCLSLSVGFLRARMRK